MVVRAVPTARHAPLVRASSGLGRSEMAGSSTCLNAVVTNPLDLLDVTHYPHVIGDDFTTETGINTTGAAVAWVADALYGGRRGRATPADYARLDRDASAVQPGADGLLFVPVLGDGERTDASLRGAITGLSLRHGGAAIARAALEGVAFAIRAQLTLLRAGGTPVTELRVSGGDARLDTWNQIKADVTGLVVRTFPGDAATSGVAMLAGLGAGVYRTPAGAIDRCVRAGPPIPPDPEATARYQASLRAYRELVESTIVRREEA
jgi:xylulokinase